MIIEQAAANLQERIKENAYPGRGIVIGRDLKGDWIQVYWIMGRSSNSRNRIFVGEGDLLRTEAADPAKVDDPSLIIYNAMRVCGRHYIVTNGAHTDDVYEGFVAGRGFAESLAGWLHDRGVRHELHTQLAELDGNGEGRFPCDARPPGAPIPAANATACG